MHAISFAMGIASQGLSTHLFDELDTLDAAARLSAAITSACNPAN